MSCEENINDYKQDPTTEFYEYPIDEAANLIINYLPVDIDEASLKVT